MTNAKNRAITLAGKVHSVPPLPLRINRMAYPLCHKLMATDLFDRAVKAKGVPAFTDEEFDDLSELAFLAILATDKTMTREATDDLPITPNELLNCFFIIRYQTGVWVPIDQAPDTGEAAGAKRPRK